SHNIGIAIELALKAFLVHHGLTERDLRQLGHNLEALLAEAEKHGLTSTGSRHFRLAVLGANYDERIFVYPREGMLNILSPHTFVKLHMKSSVKSSRALREMNS